MQTFPDSIPPPPRPGQAASTDKSHLVQKLQLLATIHQLVGVDKPSSDRARVQDEVLGHAHQNMPVVTSIGKPAHCHAAESKDERVTTGDLDGPIPGKGGGLGAEGAVTSEEAWGRQRTLSQHNACYPWTWSTTGKHSS